MVNSNHFGFWFQEAIIWRMDESSEPENTMYELEPKREHLSDEELGNLLAAFGNSEAKAITLGLMKPEVIYSLSDLYKEVLHSQGDKPGWKTSWGIPFQYCKDSLEPIGLVAREVTTDGGLQRVGYVKTEKGEQLGEELAGYLLSFSLRHQDYSLIDILGSTTSARARLQDVNGAEYKKGLRLPG